MYGSAEELGSDLVNAKSYSKKVAVLKRIIANATMGNDMSALCTSVAECMSLQDIHIKKMGYFFLSNYGMRKKEALTPYIDLFTQDAKSQDAITRASALRTMASLLTDDMVHGLLDPVRSYGRAIRVLLVRHDTHITRLVRIGPHSISGAQIAGPA